MNGEIGWNQLRRGGETLERRRLQLLRGVFPLMLSQGAETGVIVERSCSLRFGHAVVDQLARLRLVALFSQTVEGEHCSAKDVEC